MNKKSCGFTLIELLVVVLIIGILAAIALPQYEKSVMKSRLANMQQILASFKAAEEVYYMANNTYTNDSSLLDIDFSVCPPRASGSDVLLCDNYFMLDPLNGDNFNLTAIYCPAEVVKKSGSVTCLKNADFYYTVWLDRSSHPGLRTCTGVTDKGIKLCQNF